MATATVGALPGSIVTHPTGVVPFSFSDHPDLVSVFEFGAAGDGTTDDSAAFNTAFAALSGSGVGLYIPAASYVITSHAVVNPGVNVVLGEGAILTGTYAQAVAQGGAVPFYARAVMTTVATSTTYTGSGTNTITFGSNAAIGTQDGVSGLAVGDVVILQGGTLGSCTITAADVGPWIISNAGAVGAKVVLTRPSWWKTGAVLPTLSRIQIGPEGTLFGGSAWSTWAIAGKVIGTDDPLLYPDRVQTTVTLASSTVTMATIPLRSATRSAIMCSLSAVGGTTTSTVGYGLIAAPTPGYIGTCTWAVVAQASGMSKNGSSDASVVSVVVVNRP